MGRLKGRDLGGRHRILICSKCQRQFKGSIKIVNKLYKYHLKLQHNENVNLNNNYNTQQIKDCKNFEENYDKSTTFMYQTNTIF